MFSDSNNKIIQLCAEGMLLEGQGLPEKAYEIFNKAWLLAQNDFEKLIAAHYMARIQLSLEATLQWNLVALEHALQVKDERVKGSLPSLYLNIGKSYEDLNLWSKALEHYQKANQYLNYLLDDGYGHMIKEGVAAGIVRAEQRATGNTTNT